MQKERRVLWARTWGAGERVRTEGEEDRGKEIDRQTWRDHKNITLLTVATLMALASSPMSEILIVINHISILIFLHWIKLIIQ